MSPCVFLHKEKELRVVTHVDDFLVAGEQAHLEWFKHELAQHFELKAEIVGNCRQDLKEAKFLYSICLCG